MIGRSKRKLSPRLKIGLGKNFKLGKRSYYGGKGIPLKVVALSIPTYAMSFFKLPENFCS